MGSSRSEFVMTGVLVSLVPLAMAAGSHPIVDVEAVNARIQPVARVELAAVAKIGGPRSGDDMYKAVCGACHEAGVAGAVHLVPIANGAIGEILEGLEDVGRAKHGDHKGKQQCFPEPD